VNTTNIIFYPSVERHISHTGQFAYDAILQPKWEHQQCAILWLNFPGRTYDGKVLLYCCLVCLSENKCFETISLMIKVHPACKKRRSFITKVLYWGPILTQSDSRKEGESHKTFNTSAVSLDVQTTSVYMQQHHKLQFSTQ